MKHFTLLLTLLFWIAILGCKKPTDDTVTPVPGPTNPTGTGPAIPKTNFVAWVTDSKKDLGLLINDPENERQLAVFGNKTAAGDLKDVQYILSTNTAKQIWLVYEFNADYTPKSVRTSTGHFLEFSNFDKTAKTFSVKISDFATSKLLLSKDKIALDNNVIVSIDEMKKRALNDFKGARIASGSRTRSVSAAEYAYLATNAFGCVMGAAALAGEIGAAGAGLALVPLTAFNTWNSCKGAFDSLKNFTNGAPLYSCVNGDDIINSSASYTESIVGLLKDAGKAGSLASLASSVIPQILNNAIQAVDKGLCDPNDSPAHSTGDPHITTLDGLRYGFQGHGEFIAAKSTTDNFEVQVRQEDVGKNGKVTMNTAVGIQTGADVVCVTVKPDRLFINNQAQDLASFTRQTLKEGALVSKIKENGFDVLNVYVKNGDLVKVRFHGSYLLDYSLYIQENRKGKLIGIMGNYDGDKLNDVTIRDGENIMKDGGLPFAKLYPTFTDSWRITQANSLFQYDAGKNTETFTQKDFPRTELTITAEQRSKAEGICRAAGVTTEPFLSNCILDVAITNDPALASSSLWGQTINTLPSSLPVPITQEAVDVKTMRTIQSAGFILKADGTLWASGWNDHGMFGIGGQNFNEPNTKDKFLKIWDGVKEIARGSLGSHSLFLKNDNSVWAAGYNQQGQIGNGVTDGNNVRTAVKIMDGGKALATGSNNSFVIKTDNTLWAWGQDGGRLGSGTKVDKFVPIKIMDNVKAVSAGEWHTLILKMDNTLWVTGSNAYGEFGIDKDGGQLYESLTPMKVMENVKAITAAGYSSYIIKTDNTLWVTGNNNSGQLGIGTSDSGKGLIKYTKIMDDVIFVDGNNIATFIIKMDNTLWATGHNRDGQFGDGTATDQTIPKPKQVATGVKSVVTGGRHGYLENRTFILKTDNTLWAAGANLAGILGDGTDRPKLTFVPINVK